MKASKVLGTLIPALPEYQPLIKGIRENMGLGEISLDDEPITEIYLDDEIMLPGWRH